MNLAPRDPKAAQLLEDAMLARTMYLHGSIDRDQAKARIAPYLDYVNQSAKRIAKKYGMKPKSVGFAGFMR